MGKRRNLVWQDILINSCPPRPRFWQEYVKPTIATTTASTLNDIPPIWNTAYVHQLWALCFHNCLGNSACYSWKHHLIKTELYISDDTMFHRTVKLCPCAIWNTVIGCTVHWWIIVVVWKITKKRQITQNRLFWNYYVCLFFSITYFRGLLPISTQSYWIGTVRIFKKTYIYFKKTYRYLYQSPLWPLTVPRWMAIKQLWQLVWCTITVTS